VNQQGLVLPGVHRGVEGVEDPLLIGVELMGRMALSGDLFLPVGENPAALLGDQLFSP
jgi:hypothetical protein